MPPGQLPPDPDHPLIQGLDPEFGNAQYMIAWLHLLHFQLDDSQVLRHNRHLGIENGNPYYFGIETEDYLYPLDVLSGQEIPLMGATHSILEAARYQNDANKDDSRISQFVFNDLNADLERAQNTWKGAVADSVHEYRKDFQNFYPEHQKAIGQLGNCLAAYAGVIREARKDVNEVVGQFYDSLENYHYSSSFSLEYLIAALDLIVGFVLDKLPLKPDEERIFSFILDKAVGDAGTSAGPQVQGDDLLAIAKSYLAAANGICDNAKAQIRGITGRVHSDVDETLLNMGPVPTPQPVGAVSDGFEVDLGMLKDLIVTTDSSIVYFENNAKTLHIGADGMMSGYPLVGGQGGSGEFFEAGMAFSDAFKQAFQRVTDSYGAFVEGLKRLRQGLQLAYDAYQGTELRSTQSFVRLTDQFTRRP